MKTKVLKYANCGNKLVRPFMELEQFKGIENCYTAIEREEYGRKYVYIVFCIKGVFVCEGSYAIDILEREGMEEKIIQFRDGFENAWQVRPYVTILDIELNKEIGNDIEPLMAKRNERIEMLKNERESKEKQRQLEQDEAKAKRELELQNSFEQLKNGEMLPVYDFIDLLKEKGIKCHPRTMGLLNDLQKASTIGVKSANIFAPKNKGKNFQNIFELAAKLVAA